LAVSHREPEDLENALFLVSVLDGKKRRLTSAPPRTSGDRMPAFSRDGKSLAFVRGVNNGEVFLLRLTEDLRPAGEPGQLTTSGGQITTPVWSADGGHILYIFKELSVRSEIRSLSIKNPATWKRIFASEEEILELSLEHHLVYSSTDYDNDIWRSEIRSSGTPAMPQRPIASTRRDGMPRYSPDGTKIAFHSIRSGFSEIWIADADGTNPVQLTSFRGEATVGPASWSPSSREIVFHARVEGGQADLYTIPVIPGSANRLTTDASDDNLPSYSRDGSRIYFSSRRSGQPEIWVMPAQGGAASQLTHDDGGSMPIESPDGDAVYYHHRIPEKGIWKIDLQGMSARQITGPYSGYNLVVTKRGLYYTVADGPNSVRFLDFSTQQEHVVHSGVGAVQLSVSDVTLS
jgi:Tol biopolymer transport system component